MRQQGPDYGLGFQIKVPQTFQVVSSSEAVPAKTLIHQLRAVEEREKLIFGHPEMERRGRAAAREGNSNSHGARPVY